MSLLPLEDATPSILELLAYAHAGQADAVGIEITENNWPLHRSRGNKELAFVQNDDMPPWHAVDKWAELDKPVCADIRRHPEWVGHWFEIPKGE